MILEMCHKEFNQVNLLQSYLHCSLSRVCPVNKESADKSQQRKIFNAGNMAM